MRRTAIPGGSARPRNPAAAPSASVDLYWLPLGAGDASRLVRWSGSAYEAIVARSEGRERRNLYHSALAVHLDGARFVIEMTPAWCTRAADRGVVAEGPVGLAWLGRSRLFRYEVHRWKNGVIADVADVADGPQRLSSDRDLAQRVLDLVPAFPACTWGRDDLAAGEMWNSNSLTSWLLARSGHDTNGLGPPAHGRAPGWAAGLAVAERDAVAVCDDRVRRPGSVGSPRRPPLQKGARWQTVPAGADSAGKRRASSWGATRAEAGAAMPGDDLVGAAKYRTTHAVSIDASAEQVWPWLVQMGQGRGGMYSYDWLENIFGLHMQSAQRIDPALQHLTVGDCVRLVPEGTEPALRFAVARVEPPHVLVLGPDTSRAVAFAAGLPYPVWTFQLVPTSAATSRLLVRFQSDFKSTARGWIAYKYALKPVHVLMERKMMLGIKQRAERAAPAPLPTLETARPA